MYISTQQEENQRENSDKPLGKNYGIKQEKTYWIEKKKILSCLSIYEIQLRQNLKSAILDQQQKKSWNKLVGQTKLFCNFENRVLYM